MSVGGGIQIMHATAALLAPIAISRQTAQAGLHHGRLAIRKQGGMRCSGLSPEAGI
jgi:hypothetical protein